MCSALCSWLFSLTVLISTCVFLCLCTLCLGDLGRATGGETEEKEGRLRRTFRSQIQRPVVPGEYEHCTETSLNKRVCVWDIIQSCALVELFIYLKSIQVIKFGTVMFPPESEDKPV